jgi:membrane associated rhomboid family serine protease
MSNYTNNSIFGAVAPITKNLLIINFLVWIGCYFTANPNPMPSTIAHVLGLHYFKAESFYLYQLVTYIFTHDEFTHLFCNMFALFMFGSVLERTFGPKRYLIYYFVSGIGAGLVQLLIIQLQINAVIDQIPSSQLTFFYNSLPVTIGASGSIFGLLLAFGMLFPNTPLYLMFVPIPIKAKYFIIGYGLIEFFFGISSRSGDNVAHFAHLGGMLFGLILILYWKSKNKTGWKFSWWKKFTGIFKKKPVKMNHQYRRAESDWDYNARKNQENKEIDSILEKIKYSGYNSLSESEKKKLFDASKK